jgi:GAF domain-containing protein
MDAARADPAETRLTRLLDLILETAVETLGFDAATISARHGREMTTVAATDSQLIALDDAQYEAGLGPCLAVLDSIDPVYVNDLAGDKRWRHFADAATQLGVRSSLSLHVPVDGDEVAASLSLYAKQQLRLGEREIQTATRFADQLAATLQAADSYRSTAKLAADMAEAMRSRAVIEQAKGVLMAEHQIGADAAFTMLVERSQHANVKVRDLALRLVEDRAER